MDPSRTLYGQHEHLASTFSFLVDLGRLYDVIDVDVAPAAAMGIDNLERGLLARELCNIPRRPHVFDELLIPFVRAVLGARWLQSGATVD